MKLSEIRGAEDISTPAYYFNTSEFENRINLVREKLSNIPLTYSIKANPFLLRDLPKEISHVEVCSPGELDICKFYKIPGEKIIYSGVNKQAEDIEEAVRYGVDIVTCESRRHLELTAMICEKMGGSFEQKIILRLTSGNQFGMSGDDLLEILKEAAEGNYPYLSVTGIHYYSGTQKKTKLINKDIEALKAFLTLAKDQAGFIPSLVEYGPGLSVDYFKDANDESETEYLKETLEEVRKFSREYPLGVELGRFLASSCGTYATKVVDIKCNNGVNYVICDGGIHQIRYYGQTLAMQIPSIEVLSDRPLTGEKKKYCLCGSLCTVADVLVREVELPELSIGDVLLFGKCGAYSLYEGNSLFLSRNLPEIYSYGASQEVTKLRSTFKVSALFQSESNQPQR